MPAPYARRDAIQNLARAVNRNGLGQAQGRFRGLSPTGSGVAQSTRTDPQTGVFAELHQIDKWDVTDDATADFLTTFLAVDASWNVSLNGVSLIDGVDYSLSGRTLTALDPADLFLGADTQGTPWTLQVQYDYLSGGPAAEPTAGPIRYRSVTPGDATVFWPNAYNDSAWTLVGPPFEFGAGTWPGPHTNPWTVTTDLQVRQEITATPGFDLTVTYGIDDGGDFYWNGTLLGSVGIGNSTFTIPGADVLEDNIIAVRGFDTNPAGRGVSVEVTLA